MIRQVDRHFKKKVLSIPPNLSGISTRYFIPTQWEKEDWSDDGYFNINQSELCELEGNAPSVGSGVIIVLANTQERG